MKSIEVLSLFALAAIIMLQPAAPAQPDSSYTFWLIWSTNISHINALTILSGPTVIAGTADGKILAINILGNITWQLNTGSPVKWMISSDSPQTVLAATDKKILLISLNGTILWKAEPGTITDLDAATGLNLIAVLTEQRKLSVYRKDGSLLWEQTLEKPYQRVALAADGSYIAVASENQISLYEKSGNHLWTKQIKVDITLPRPVAVAPEAKYVAAIMPSKNGDAAPIALFNRNGEHLRTFEMTSPQAIFFPPKSQSLYLICRKKAIIYEIFHLGRDVIGAQAGFLASKKGETAEIAGWGVSWQLPTLAAVTISKDGKQFNATIYSIASWELLYSTPLNTSGTTTAAAALGEYVAFTVDSKIFLYAHPSDYTLELLRLADQAVAEAKELGVNTTNLEELQRQALFAWARKQYRTAKELALQIISKTRNQANLQQAAESSIEKLSAELNKTLNAGIQVHEAQTLLAQAEKAASQGNYSAALKLAKKGLNILKQKTMELNQTLKTLDEATTLRDKLKAEGQNTTEISSLLKQAQKALQEGNYSQASQLATKALQKANETLKKLEEKAKKQIEKASKAISEASNAGLPTTQAEKTLKKALKALQNSHYTQAISLAEKAYTQATDVDNDGIPNKADPLPTVNNNLIYIATAAAAIAAAGLYQKTKHSHKPTPSPPTNHHKNRN